MNGIRVLSTRLGVEGLLAPVALLVGLNAVGGAAAYLSSTSRLPFVAGHRSLPALCLRKDSSTVSHAMGRDRRVWVGTGSLVALLGQAGTTVRSAYDVLVAMGIISYFLPYLFLVCRDDQAAGTAGWSRSRRVPGGKPVAILLASVGLASTALTIVLSAFPAHDDPNKPLAVAKVVGGTIVLVGAGVAVFLLERRRARTRALL